ncbi:MAG: hypothetical protein FK733_14525 [Asgard group archaeon]|nr:hypothetical protein [Asgard group archaeon]
MKITNKKILITFLLLIIAVPIISFSITNAQAYNTRDFGIYEMTFTHAEYLDADLDGSEDDTRFSVYVYFNPEFFDGSIVKLDCLFEIILPSGITHTFKGYIRLESRSCTIQFDVYNTVTEPGWYTINFYSSVRIFNLRYTCFCTTIFDPPTGTGEGGGTPTIGF